jgi:carboxypeptidase PM20D1
MLRIFGVFVLALASLAGFMIWRTVQYIQPQAVETVAVAPGANIDYAIDLSSQRLSQALQFKTIVNEAGDPIDPAAFAAFNAWILANYPNLAAVVSVEQMGDGAHSLLLTWQGSNLAAKPIIFSVHSDTRPVDAAQASQWSVDPFGGVIKENDSGKLAIWGRGTLKGKGPLVGVLEAADALAAKKFRPKKTIYIAIGHDGEARGEKGAKRIAEELQRRKVRAWYVLNEGFGVLARMPLSPNTQAALIGVDEKQEAMLRVEARSGATATVGAGQAVTDLAGAVVALSQTALSPTLQDPVMQETLKTLAPNMPKPMAFAFANTWLTSPFLMRQLAQRPGAAAMMTTTVAPVMAAGGQTDSANASGVATAMVRVLLHPADSPDAFLSRAKIRLARYPDVTISWAGPIEPRVPPSSRTSDSYRTLAALVRNVSREQAVVAPALFPLPTDGRHFHDVADDVYRFTPNYWTDSNIQSLLGANGNITQEELQRMIGFYAQLMSETAD